ncbi:MAG: JAB domain-containing protein [Acetobacter sp.]
MAKAKVPPTAPSAVSGGGAVFASTGPVGHRKRMRQKVLAHGAGGLADYELLEMLLFYGVPRRDTKPLAKSLINQFGSLSAVLESGVAGLQGGGVPLKAAALCAQLPGIAANLVSDGHAPRPYMGDWDSLVQYCTTVLKTGERPHRHILFLDSRNTLLLDEQLVWPTVAPEAEALRQAVSHVLQRALQVQACAVVSVHLVENEQEVQARLNNDAPFVTALRKAAPLLAVSLHDHLVVGRTGWASARQTGVDW